MKLPTICLCLASAVSCFADEEIAAKAVSGHFEIVQEFRGISLETIRFPKGQFSPVQLAGYPWPGIYEISPDEQWVFRTQKVGAGESIAMLYRVEKNGRVSEVIGFNEALWKVADEKARLKRKQLYHTGIVSVGWSKDSSTLEIKFRGKNAEQSGDGIEVILVYDLKKSVISRKAL